MSFTVAASGTAPLTYQWRKDGSDIGGATAATYAIPAPAAGDAGSYDVVVSNACGSTTSAAATLAVDTAPTITTQPGDLTACEGAPASFTVVASGGGLDLSVAEGRIGHRRRDGRDVCDPGSGCRGRRNLRRRRLERVRIGDEHRGDLTVAASLRRSRLNQ